MDTARRWQVVSIATTVAGLGLGSLLVGRSPSVDVAPIDLDVVVAAAPQPSSVEDVLPPPPEIVTPTVREDHVEPSPSVGSTADADPSGPVTDRAPDASAVTITSAVSTASPAESITRSPAPVDASAESPDSDTSLSEASVDSAS